MLKISKDFHMKEAWEGLQRAGHSRTSSGLGSSEGPREVLTKGFHESPRSLTKTARLSVSCSDTSRSAASNKHSQ